MKQLVYGVSRALAWFGAAVLAAIATMSVISIAGRALSAFGLGPVPGDFELVEAGTALAVFCFMPWAHLTRGHAVVDMLWGNFPRGMQRALEILADALMLVAWLVLTWRMSIAMHDYYINGEVTFILQFKVWWGYAASFVPAVIGCLVYAWRLLETLGVVEAPAGLVSGEVVH